MVVVGVADADVLAPGHTCQVSQPRECVDSRRIGHKAGPRATFAHPGHLRIDDAGVGRMHLLVAHAPAVEYADRKVVDHHVCVRTQLPAQRPCLVVLHVQSERTFVAIPHDVVGAFRVVRDQCPLMRIHLHDIGAHVAQYARREWTGKHVGEVEDAQTVQRTRALWSRTLWSCALWRRALWSWVACLCVPHA